MAGRGSAPFSRCPRSGPPTSARTPGASPPLCWGGGGREDGGAVPDWRRRPPRRTRASPGKWPEKLRACGDAASPTSGRRAGGRDLASLGACWLRPRSWRDFHVHSPVCGFNLCRMNLDYLVIKFNDKWFHGFCVHFKCTQQEKARRARGPGLWFPPGRALEGLWAGPVGGSGGLEEEPPEGPRGRQSVRTRGVIRRPEQQVPGSGSQGLCGRVEHCPLGKRVGRGPQGRGDIGTHAAGGASCLPGGWGAGWEQLGERT